MRGDGHVGLDPATPAACSENNISEIGFLC